MSNEHEEWKRLCDKLDIAQKEQSKKLLVITDKFYKSLPTSEDDHQNFDLAVKNVTSIKEEMDKFILSNF
jgi:hypothetical protein